MNASQVFQNNHEFSHWIAIASKSKVTNFYLQYELYYFTLEKQFFDSFFFGCFDPEKEY